MEGEHEESDVVSKVVSGGISTFFLGSAPPPSFSFVDAAAHGDAGGQVDRSCHAGRRRVKNSSAVFTGGLRQ